MLAAIAMLLVGAQATNAFHLAVAVAGHSRVARLPLRHAGPAPVAVQACRGVCRAHVQVPRRAAAVRMAASTIGGATEAVKVRARERDDRCSRSQDAGCACDIRPHHGMQLSAP